MAQPRERIRTGRERQVLSSPEDYRDNIIRITALAQRGLAIITPDLEPEIYAHPNFLEALKRFVLAKSFARIRVLVTTPERAMKSGNQFVEMGRRLNSYIEFRNLAEDHRPRQEAYCIADDFAVVYRPKFESWEGVADSEAPPVAQMYLESFDKLWQISETEAYAASH
jgi:hypothetical protein